jgi:HAD superfamily hydrolase (TIGR01509 family)
MNAASKSRSSPAPGKSVGFRKCGTPNHVLDAPTGAAAVHEHDETDPVRAVVFDIGETLVDETGMWERAADAAGVPRFTLMGVLGGLAARGEHHDHAWELLAVTQPDSTWESTDLYPDALPCIEALRARGLRVAAVGNTPRETEDLMRGYIEVLGSSERWGVSKPDPAFFERIIATLRLPPGEIAYVGDRVDNDVRPALGAGMLAVHIRRGPWGYLQTGAEDAHLRIASLESFRRSWCRSELLGRATRESYIVSPEARSYVASAPPSAASHLRRGTNQKLNVARGRARAVRAAAPRRN